MKSRLVKVYQQLIQILISKIAISQNISAYTLIICNTDPTKESTFGMDTS